MADVLLDSTVRLMWDPDGEAIVLLQVGDPMWSLVKFDGQQIVDVAGFVRGLGSKAFARGNESFDVVFEIVRETTGPVAAFKQRLKNIIALPKGSADLLLSFDIGEEDEMHFRLKDCAIRSWPGFQEEHLAVEQINIVGGLLILDEGGPYEEGETWGEESP